MRLCNFLVDCWLRKIDFESRFDGRKEGSTYYLTVDGTDFSIPEPVPFDKKWFSHKFKGPGLRYEVAVGIYNGLICWVNGPFPCGSWPDAKIAKDSLHLMLEDGERYVADRGYRACRPIAITPTNLSRFIDRQWGSLRARHECINRRLKQFTILQHRFRHPINKHSSVFRAVANITNMKLKGESPIWKLDFDENEIE